MTTGDRRRRSVLSGRFLSEVVPIWPAAYRVNLGNPTEGTIIEIIDLTGSGSKIIMKSLPEDDPRQR